MRKIPFLFLSMFLAVFGLVTMASLVTAANNQSSNIPQSEPALMSTLLLVDNFEYGDVPGDLTAVSSWMPHSGAGSGPVQYITASLSMPGYGSSGVGGAATISTAGAEDIHRPFTNQTTGVVYFASLVNISEARTPVAGDYFLHLADTGTGFRARVFVRDNGGVLEYGMGAGGTGTYSSTPFSYNTTYLVVARYNVDNGDVALYVLDEVAANEPATPLVQVAGAGGQAVQRMAIRQGAPTTRPAATIDGVRVANSWEDVVGYTGPVEISKSVTPETNAPYQGVVTYTVTLENISAVSETVVFTDTLPTEVDFVGWVETPPAGTDVTADVITWNGTLTASTALTFNFTAVHVGDYGDVVTNTAVFSGATQTGSAEAVFTVESLISDVTFVYNDLEGVVEMGETVWIAGSFNGWTPVLMNAAGGGVYTYTVMGLATGDTHQYKYIIDSGGQQWDWLNTFDRSYTVVGSETVNDYRNVVVGYAVLQWPPTLTGTMYAATADVYGQLYINEVTNPPGEGRGLKAEVGYGDDSDPANWEWFPMSFAGQSGNNDEFVGVITPTLPGVFSYTVRFDGNSAPGNPNAGWTYGDLTGVGPYPGGEFSLSDTGVIDVEFASVPIAVARAGSNGEVLGLEGVVTAQNSTWSNASEWTFQDASGGIAAFFIADPPISLGDTVRMVATRGMFNNQEQMVTPLYYFEIVSSGPPVEPITYTTGQVASGDSEGWLIEIEGDITVMPGTCGGTGYNVTVNDGSGPAVVRIDTAIGVNLCALGLQVGDRLGVVGFSTQFHSSNPNLGFQLKPRGVGDIKLFVDAPVVIGSVPANNATNVLTDTLVTIQFSEPVTVTTDWYAIQCSVSGVVSATATSGPADSYVITPDNPFAFGEICHVTIFADEVEDGEGNNMLANYQFNFTVGPAPVLGSCGDPATPIHFIQGSGASTPIFGAGVVVEAVVVGSYQATGQFNGFFLQERDGRVDNDPMTSEGIFVFHSATPVMPGQLVRVRGTATEFNGLTQLGSVTAANIAVCDVGYTVTPAEVTLPVADMMEWEAVEGMLVSFTHELFVTEHFNLGRFGEVPLSVNDRLWNPTNVVAPGAPALALQDLNNRSRITLDDGINTQNPDPVIYPHPKLTYTNTLRTGAMVPNLMGVVDFRSNRYRIQPVGVVEFENTADRPYEMDDVGGDIQVASFNVLNYFVTLDTGANICGPGQNMGCRGANSAFELERQRTKILNAILQMDADVVGLIEIENHHADAAVIDLVAGLNAAAGAGTYAYINTGVIGTDAIKQAFIYQPAAVTPVGAYAILDSSFDPAYIDTKSRPVLIQTFAENNSGELFTVAVNHLKSKGSPCDDVGDPDVGDGQGNCNLTRTAAAQVLINFLATDPTNSGSDRFLIIGDINAYAMEDPIMAIVNAGYTDLLRLYYGDQAYTYVFDGQFGHLDHGLASAAIMPFVTGATAWNINADEPRVLDYNVEFKTAGQIIEWYSPEPFRSSDHDPVIIGLFFPTVTILSPEDGDEFESLDGSAVTVPVVITTTDFVIPDDGHWHLWLNGVDQGPVMGYTTTLQLSGGVYTITAQLRLPDHTSLNIVDSVTIEVIEPTVEITAPEDGAVYFVAEGNEATVGVTIATTNFDIPDDGHWHLWLNGVDQGPVMGYTTTLQLPAGAYTITAQLRLPDHTPLDFLDSVMVEVIEAAVEITAPEDGAVYFVAEGNEVTVGVTIATTNFDIPADGHWHLWVNGVMTEMVYTNQTTVTLGAGEYELAAELVLPDHSSLGIVDSVTVHVADTDIMITSPADGATFTSVNNAAITVPVVVTTTEFIIPDDGYWRLWVDGVEIESVFDYATTIDLTAGTYAISAELWTADHVALGSVDTVTITINAVYELYLPIIMNGAEMTGEAAVVPTTPTPTGNMALLFSLPLLLVGLSFSRRSSQPAR